VPPGGKRVFRFDLTTSRTDRPCPRSALSWPTTVNLHVGGPEAGVEYALGPLEWTAHHPDTPRVCLGSLQAPLVLVPGAAAGLAGGTDGWLGFRLPFTTPAGTVSMRLWIHSYNAADVEAYLDDLRVEAGS
jgi:hypothetical protein